MFTGIVEEIGFVKEVRQSSMSLRLTIAAEKILSDVHIGDSISVNGVCLTVTSFNDGAFSVDVMPETVKSTNLNHIKIGSRVNLERALASGARLGGHYVTGHIDGTGIIKHKRRMENAVYYEIEASPSLLHYMVMKGSVAVDGTSLTIFDLSRHSFTVSLIPHTLTETILGEKKPGDSVNIECDILAKYTEKLLKSQAKSQKLDEAYLREHGFM